MRVKITIPLLMLICFITNNKLIAQDRLYHNQFPLADVQLLDGPFKHARDLNVKVLLEYDIDRLLQ